eukprot:CAMPEP_0197467564 /NCGR_PEP_ID=MMETSP1175-20131217/65634_1 /TAXON_ID=1003142 /ORGANISM="Triceratium dubium, Strain CCMP147" /LENGTH=289 /DNA_ID=CAMNT_0043003641 /DNA_START=20 /DNA_END=886 /DNA_ORIENTATION=+
MTADNFNECAAASVVGDRPERTAPRRDASTGGTEEEKPSFSSQKEDRAEAEQYRRNFSREAPRARVGTRAGVGGEATSAVWVSLSLCADGNREYLRRVGLDGAKADFPYEDAAITAVRLWHEVAGARVVVSVVTERDDGREPDVARRLRSGEAGPDVAVRVVRPNPGLNCVTESQMQRMYAHEHPDIHDDDVVVTADVDSFPTTPRVLDPLRNASHSAWIWQYKHSEDGAVNFPMSFIAMRASLWRNMTRGFWDGGTKKKSEGWMTDQILLTRMLLKHGICSISRPRVW